MSSLLTAPLAAWSRLQLALRARVQRLLANEQLQRTALAILDQAVVSGTNFVTSVILGRCTGRSELGVYYLALSLVLLVRGAQERLVSSPYTIYAARKQGAELHAYAGSTLAHQLLLSLLACGGLAIAGGLGLFAGGLAPLYTLLLVAAPLLWLREFVRQRLFAHLQSGAALTLDAAISAVQIGLLLYFGWLGVLNVGLTLGVMACCCGLAATICLALRPPLLATTVKQMLADWCENWGFARWALASYLLACTGPSILPWAVAYCGGEADTGSLGGCTTLVGLSNMFLLGFANYFCPRAAQAYAHGGTRDLRSQLRRAQLILVACLTPLVAAAALAGDWLAVAVYGPDFQNTRWIITALALAVLANSFGVVAGNGLWAMDRPKASFLADIAALVASLISAVCLIPLLGPLGAALAALCGNTCDAAVRLWVLQKALAERSQEEPPTPPEVA